MSTSTSRSAPSAEGPQWLDYVVYCGGFFLALLAPLLIGGLTGASWSMLAQDTKDDYSLPVVVLGVVGFMIGACQPVVAYLLATRNVSPLRTAFGIGVVPVLMGLVGWAGWHFSGREEDIPMGGFLGVAGGLFITLMTAAIWAIMRTKAGHWAKIEADSKAEQHDA